MAVRVYFSTDSGAPVLSGTAGSLIALLDACLISGYGTAPNAKAGAGWAKAFSGTNVAVYRAATGLRHFHRFDDAGTTGARARGYEAMTDATDTGTGPFPTDAQISGGGYVYKSASANTTAVPWVLITNGRTVYLIVQSQAGFENSSVHMFGEITSYKAGDAYHSAIICQPSTPNGNGSYFASISSNSGNFSALNGHYLARSHTQVTGAVTCGKSSDYTRGAHAGTHPYPDPVTGGILLAPLYVLEAGANVTRGVLPGIWSQLHGANNTAVGPMLGTFDGTGELAGRSFMFFSCFSAQGGFAVRLVAEISDTW